MAKPKKFKDSVRISLVLPKAQVDRIKYLAIKMSSSEGRLITPSEAIRSVIEQAYPVPKQKGLF